VSQSLTFDFGAPVHAEWPGERVETVALMPPSMISILPHTLIENAFAPASTSDPFVTLREVWSALLAVCALTAGAAAVTPLVFLLFFR